MTQQRVAEHFAEAAALVNKLAQDEAFLASVDAAGQLLVQCFKSGGKVISCGNGGSHCDAMHFAEELSGRYRDNRPGLPAMAVSDVSHITCVGNDYGFDHIFSRHVEAFGKAGDVLLGISTSGKSPNVLRAVAEAKARGMQVIALTGKDGGALAREADVAIVVPHFGYADRIQEIHIKVIHTLIDLVERGMGYA
ncbi:D-sedoheptulose 7-phosphate isomerase [Niveibacterium sp. SC-1]|uniref:D-sedoheptulose 7-phosphate isomerase n=1 Tax=Niveibacterium sp. SC-1 TaxID=3135646 RepID=UPI00311D7DFC